MCRFLPKIPVPVVLAFLCLLVQPSYLQANPSQPVAAALPAEPLFSRHVVPLFSRLGCNAGSCHGAVQGKNGFRLSLFGADPAADYQRLLREFGGRRLNLAEPEASLLLQKASGRVPHEGGKLLEVGSPGYQMLLTWLVRGAPLDAVEKSQVQELTVEPRQHTAKGGTNYALRVRARFVDGSTEDVTALSTFDCRDRDVARVDRTGQVAVTGIGSARLVIRYGGQPVGAQLLSPGDPKDAFPQVKEHNFIDKHVLAKLRQLNIHPSELCDDVTFLRRASLDVAGELPTPEEIRKFVADKNPDKRDKKIDELLARRGHATVWATKFCDLLKPQFPSGNGSEGKYPVTLVSHVRRFYEWVRVRLEENVPYDQFVERILLATTAEGRDLEEVSKEFRQYAEEDREQATDLKAYTRRRTLDTFWLRRDATRIPGTIQFGHAFLGLRLQCAQCHRHPADVWQQDDLLSFANFFMRVGKLPDSRSAEDRKSQEAAAKQIQMQVAQLREQAKDKKLTKEEADQMLAQANTLSRDLEIKERITSYHTIYTVGVLTKAEFAKISSSLGTAESKQFRLLGAKELLNVDPAEDPRKHVMAWLRQPDNPYFAKAIVNRVWAHYFGRGIIDPPDDLSPLNPPTHPELLDELCAGLIKNGYDLRWLHRTILASRAYQQSSAPSASNEHDTAHYARFHLRRMSAEVLVDAINHATGCQETFPPGLFLPAGARAMEVPGPTAHGPGGGRSFATLDYAFSIFGRSPRRTESSCDCDSSSEPSVLQSLYLAAYGNVLSKLQDPKGRPAQLAKLADDDQRIEEAFLWALSRLPTAQDRQLCRRHLKQAATPEKGMEDLLWALLNTREFMLVR